MLLQGVYLAILAAGAPDDPSRPALDRVSLPTPAEAVAVIAYAQPSTPPTDPEGAPPRPERAGQSAANNAAENEITPELNQAVRKGLAALARLQRQDGSFGDGAFGGNVAVTSLACLAYMSDGSMPNRGPYGEVVAKGLEYVLSQCQDNGLIAGENANGPMYGHGFATLFLGEVYGMTPGGGDTRQAARVHQALVKAVRLIQTTQNEEGGWRYNPVPYDADVSVTICQVAALRSARNAGLEVPRSTIDKAVEYIRACQNPDGGYRYQSTMGTSAWPRSAAGVATLYYAGIYEDASLDRGLRYLADQGVPSQSPQQIHYWYGHYYAVQAMFLAGGERWANWWPAARREVMDQQGQDGLWDDISVGKAYGTSMALIILQKPNRYLPIFQK